MKTSNIKTWVIIGCVLVVIVVLFGWSAANNPNRAVVRAWKLANVNCLPEGGQLAQHFHPVLTIRVNGNTEAMPTDIGVLPNCSAEVHTHDTTGTIHIETTATTKRFTLGQFFDVWGKPIVRTGYQTLVTVNGSGFAETEEAYRALELADKQEITIDYTTVASGE